MQEEYIYSEVGRGARLGQDDAYSDKEISEKLGNVLKQLFVFQFKS